MAVETPVSGGDAGDNIASSFVISHTNVLFFRNRKGYF
jgi:hypothetical protein